MCDVFGGDCLVAKEMSEHRSARVDEDAQVDGEILMGFEREDLAWLFVVVEEAEVGELQVVDWDAVEVGGVEGETDFVYGYVDCVGLGV
jgi:hypothetical protein